MSIDDKSLRNVLVTGGAGYIGSHIVFKLLETRRYKVISIDNYHNSYPTALARVSKLARSLLPENPSQRDLDSTVIDAYSCDLTKPDDIRAVFDRYGKGGIWGVIHVAAYKAVGESTQIPLTYYANNVSATLYLLQIMSEYDCTRMVYSSSATVYGTPPVIPIPETTRLKADSPYGKTKIMSETMLEDLCHAEPERWRAISLRYFNPAGAHPSGLIGEEPRGRPGNLLPLLSHMAAGRVKEDTLKVFGNDYPTPDGTCVRDYLHVLDLAAGHLLALDALDDSSIVFDNCPTEARYKAYNLGKGKGMSVLQILEAMRKATGFGYKYEIIGRRRGDVPDLTADPTLAEKELGFRAPQNLETMCRDLWNWQTKNPDGYSDVEEDEVLFDVPRVNVSISSVGNMSEDGSAFHSESSTDVDPDSHPESPLTPLTPSVSFSMVAVEDDETPKTEINFLSLNGHGQDKINACCAMADSSLDSDDQELRSTGSEEVRRINGCGSSLETRLRDAFAVKTPTACNL